MPARYAIVETLTAVSGRCSVMPVGGNFLFPARFFEIPITKRIISHVWRRTLKLAKKRRTRSKSNSVYRLRAPLMGGAPAAHPGARGAHGKLDRGCRNFTREPAAAQNDAGRSGKSIVLPASAVKLGHRCKFLNHVAGESTFQHAPIPVSRGRCGQVHAAVVIKAEDILHRDDRRIGNRR